MHNVTIEDYLTRYFRDTPGIMELRVLPKVKGGQPIARQGFTDISELARVTEAFAEIGNVYINTAVFDEKALAEDSYPIERAIGRPTLHVDLDPKNGATIDDLRRRLEAFPIPPSFVVASGGGLQPQWFVRDGIRKNDLDRAKMLIPRLVAALEGDLGAKDLVRILRPPHTFNYKYAPPRKVLLEQWHPDREVTLDHIEKVLAELVGAAAPAGLSIPGPVTTDPVTSPDSTEEVVFVQDDGEKLPLDLIEEVFERCEMLDKWRWCAREEGRLCPAEDGEHENNARISMALLYKAFEDGPRAAIDGVFRHVDDFDEGKTRYRLRELKGKPPRCSSICKEQCAAIQELGKKSPIAFAFHKRREDLKPDEQKTGDTLWDSVKPDGTRVWKSSGDRMIESITLDKLPIKPIRWLWKDRLAQNKTALFAGDPGTGKSIVVGDIVARVTIGAPWPDGSGNAPIGRALVMTFEDDHADTYKVRLQAAGADMANVEVIRGARAGAHVPMFNLEHDLPAVDRILSASPATRIVVIDPISAAMGKIDSHQNTQVRNVLAPLEALAGRHDVALVLISHLSKAAGTAGLRNQYAILGSIAFSAMARIAYLVYEDPDDKEEGHLKRCIIQPVKANITDDMSCLAYRKKKVMFEVDGELHITVQVLWEQETIKANKLFRQKGRPSEKRDTARHVILKMLEKGPALARDINEVAKNLRLSPDTMKRAADDLGVVIEPGHDSQHWWWKLPDKGERP